MCSAIHVDSACCSMRTRAKYVENAEALGHAKLTGMPYASGKLMSEMGSRYFTRALHRDLSSTISLHRGRCLVCAACGRGESNLASSRDIARSRLSFAAAPPPRSSFRDALLRRVLPWVLLKVDFLKRNLSPVLLLSPRRRRSQQHVPQVPRMMTTSRGTMMATPSRPPRRLVVSLCPGSVDPTSSSELVPNIVERRASWWGGVAAEPAIVVVVAASALRAELLRMVKGSLDMAVPIQSGRIETWKLPALRESRMVLGTRQMNCKALVWLAQPLSSWTHEAFSVVPVPSIAAWVVVLNVVSDCERLALA